MGMLQDDSLLIVYGEHAMMGTEKEGGERI